MVLLMGQIVCFMKCSSVHAPTMRRILLDDQKDFVCDYGVTPRPFLTVRKRIKQ